MFRKSVHADGACLRAGRCVAYYPSQIPFHHKGAWMKEGTDPFGEFVEGCRDCEDFGDPEHSEKCYNSSLANKMATGSRWQRDRRFKN